MKNEKGMLEKNTRFAIKKLSIGAAAVLVSTSMYLGMRSSNVLADTNDNASVATKDNSNDNKQDINEESLSESNPKTNSLNNNELATHQNETSITSAPLYTTQGQVPALDMNSMFTQEQLDQYGDNPQIDWVTKPEVTNIGNVTGTAELTYEDMDADPTEDGAVPTKTATVNVPVLVRKAEQEAKANQVKNSLDVINSNNNSLVAHYEWIGDKAANDEDEVSIPGRDDLESNFMSIIENLGFELDDGSEFPEDLMTFGTTNKSATMFVHPTSTAPVITDDPYFDANGNSSIDNVSKNPDAANYIGNLGVLPEGTKIEWNVAPTYEWKKEDGNYINPEPTNNPSIKVTIPGKDPIILDSDPNGDPLKEIATLPDYGDSTLLISPNNPLSLGDSVNEPTDYVTNLDSFINNYLENNGEQRNADNIQKFKKSFEWTIKPNTQQAGYTFGVFKYNDNVGNLILFKVNPTKVDNSKTITRTITFEGLPQDQIPEDVHQTVAFTQNGEQTYIDQPIDWKTNDNTWKAIPLNTIIENNVVYTPTITIDGKVVKSIDEVIVKPDTKDSNVTVTYQKSTTGDVITEPAKSVASVVIYETKDGKVVKTDIKEQKPGDKVEFNIPDSYVPVDKLPDITVTSDMGPIKVIVIKKETATDTPETISNKVASVVNYETKDGKVVKTDVKEQKPGEKVEFNVPEGYVPADKLPDVTVTSDMKPITITVIKKETATGTPETTPVKSVATVVIYQTKDGKVVKTDIKEQKPGEKVEFNVPDGYVPVDKLPDVTVTSDMKPITIIVFKETPDTPPAGPQPTKSTPSDPKPDQKPDTPTTPSVPDPVVPETETTEAHAGNSSTALIESAPVKVSGVDEGTAKVGSTNNEKSQNTLPQTGSKSLAGILLGSVLLAASLALGFVNKKKRN